MSSGDGIFQVARTRCKDESVVSTIYIKLPLNIKLPMPEYETAILTEAGTEVVYRYDNLTDAREGHQRYVRAGGGAAFFQ
jgi:hypothetical protein